MAKKKHFFTLLALHIHVKFRWQKALMTKKTLLPAFSITYSRQIPLVKSTDEQKHFFTILALHIHVKFRW